MEPKTDSPGEPTFYNVMPQDDSGPLVSATAETPTVSSAEVSRTNVSSFADPHLSIAHSEPRTKLIIGAVIVGGLILIGVVGYFAYVYARDHKTTNTNTQVNTEPTTNTETGTTPTPVTTPAEWQQRYFSAAECQDTSVCGDTSDPDRDGLANLDEYNNKTDPNNPDSDGDGLADGDEINIFGGSVLTARTDSTGDYSDADYAKGGYDVTTTNKFTDEKLTQIKAKIKEKGLHQPTITTLGADNLKQYDFTDFNLSSIPTDSSAIDSSIDQSPTAKLGRDTQRLSTIQKVAGGLIKYKAEKKLYPDTTDFNTMVAAVKSYIGVATNYSDPINKDKYVYGYVSVNGGADFTLLYFSETQNQVIKYTGQQAELDAVKQDASANDNRRIQDIEHIAQALGIYSDSHIDTASDQMHVFPLEAEFKSALVPQYLSVLPVDPRTGKDYDYQVSDKFDTFTLRAIFDNPPKGYTGYMCNQDECHNY